MNINNAKVLRLAATVLSITVVPFISAEVVYNPSSSKSSMYPVVASLDINNPICYMQKANGATLNLSSLCGEHLSKKPLSEIDQKFIESYKNSMSSYQEAQALVIRRTEKDPQSTIKMAQGVCMALNEKMSFTTIRKNQYDTIVKSVTARSQEIALIEAQIIESLAPQFYCPKLAK